MSFKKNNLVNFYSTAMATAIAECATLPICTIKTNYQMVNSNSLLSTTRSIYNSNGLKGFFRASFPAIFGQIMSSSLKYTGFRFLDNSHILSQNKFINGCIAGLTSTIITHPLDVWKVYLQTGKNTNFLNDLQKKPMILYRGYSKTITKISISSSLFFPLYDYSNIFIKNPILAAGISATISTIIIHPIDYLKTRHMLNRKIYQGLNPLIYYNGLHISLLRIVPHFIITMSCIEFFTKLFSF